MGALGHHAQAVVGATLSTYSAMQTPVRCTCDVQVAPHMGTHKHMNISGFCASANAVRQAYKGLCVGTKPPNSPIRV